MRHPICLCFSHLSKVRSHRFHSELERWNAGLHKTTSGTHRAPYNGHVDIEDEVHHQQAAQYHQSPGRKSPHRCHSRRKVGKESVIALVKPAWSSCTRSKRHQKWPRTKQSSHYVKLGKSHNLCTTFASSMLVSHSPVKTNGWNGAVNSSVLFQ